jgi:hypothetical protein
LSCGCTPGLSTFKDSPAAHLGCSNAEPLHANKKKPQARRLGLCGLGSVFLCEKKAHAQHKHWLNSYYFNSNLISLPSVIQRFGLACCGGGVGAIGTDFPADV